MGTSPCFEGPAICARGSMCDLRYDACKVFYYRCNVAEDFHGLTRRYGICATVQSGVQTIAFNAQRRRNNSMQRRNQGTSDAIFYRVISLVCQGARIMRPFNNGFLANAVLRQLLSVVAKGVYRRSMGPCASLLQVLFPRLSLAISNPTWRPFKVLTTCSAANGGLANA